MKPIIRLLNVLSPLRPALIGLFILTTLGAIVSSAVPWLYREVVNFLTTKQNSHLFSLIMPPDASIVIKLAYLVGIYFVVLFIDDVIAYSSRFFINMTRERSYQILRMESIKRLQKLSTSFFQNNPPGALKEKLGEGTNQAFSVIQTAVWDVWPTLFKFVLAVVAIAFINIWIAAGLTVVMVGYGALAIVRTKINVASEKLARPKFEEQSKKIITVLTHQELIKQFTREDTIESEFATIYAYIYKVRTRRALLAAWIHLAQDFLWKLIVVMVYGYGGYLVLVPQTLKVGDLLLFLAYMDRVMFPLDYVLTSYDNMQTSMVSIVRMFQVWDEPIEITDVDGAEPIKVVRGGVEFRNMTFRYRDPQDKNRDKLVFKNFNLTVLPGETVALVGPSGAGKSTLVKLLLRFYDPASGQILLDGQDIKTHTQKSVRQNVSAIMQEVAVFNDTIKANLRYAKKSAKNEDLWRVLKLASLDEFVRKLPKKLDTVLGERGLRLSGGERQRLGIARALLKDSPIIVMDEATSALDSENEHRIQEAIAALIRNKTTIVIAHRLSTVKKADRIVVLDRGRVVEQGTHAQLLKRPKGYYKKLYKMQGVLLQD